MYQRKFSSTIKINYFLWVVWADLCRYRLIFFQSLFTLQKKNDCLNKVFFLQNLPIRSEHAPVFPNSQWTRSMQFWPHCRKSYNVLAAK